jgi:DNA-binding NarL/FixJ family response regulator
MANIKTHIFCYDDHRGFSEDVRRRFTDSSRYKVLSFNTREEFINQLEEERDHNFCKIAIIGLHDTGEQYDMINQLAREIMKIDHRTGLILIGPADKIEEIKKAERFNVDAYIPKNTNSILRLHNIVKKLISEHNINVFRKRRNFTLYVFLIFFLACILLILITRLKLPQYY